MDWAQREIQREVAMEPEQHKWMEPRVQSEKVARHDKTDPYNNGEHSTWGNTLQLRTGEMRKISNLQFFGI